MNALSAWPLVSSILDFMNVVIMGLSLLPLTILGIRRPREAGLTLIACVPCGMVGYALLVGPKHMFVGSQGFLKFFMLFPAPYLVVGLLFLMSGGTTDVSEARRDVLR
jgi:hypothetical protein